MNMALVPEQLLNVGLEHRFTAWENRAEKDTGRQDRGHCQRLENTVCTCAVQDTCMIMMIK